MFEYHIFMTSLMTFGWLLVLNLFKEIIYTAFAVIGKVNRSSTGVGLLSQISSFFSLYKQQDIATRNAHV